MTQEEMAFTVAKGSGGSWGVYEKGRSIPSAEVISELCLLGVNANWVLTGVGSIIRPDMPAEKLMKNNG